MYGSADQHCGLQVTNSEERGPLLATGPRRGNQNESADLL